MTSFNHYALGAIADWLHRSVAGLAPAAPGYARIAVEPHPLDGFTHAEAAHRTPYGLARVRWERDGDAVRVDAVVPPNTEADVQLPDGRRFTVGSGSHHWVSDAPEAAAAAGAVGFDSSLAELLDDAEAYQAVLAALAERKPAVVADFRDATDWSDRLTLGDRLQRLTGPETRAAVAERLAELTARRTAERV